MLRQVLHTRGRSLLQCVVSHRFERSWRAVSRCASLCSCPPRPRRCCHRPLGHCPRRLLHSQHNCTRRITASFLCLRNPGQVEAEQTPPERAPSLLLLIRCTAFPLAQHLLSPSDPRLVCPCRSLLVGHVFSVARLGQQALGQPGSRSREDEIKTYRDDSVRRYFGSRRTTVGGLASCVEAGPVKPGARNGPSRPWRRLQRSRDTAGVGGARADGAPEETPRGHYRRRVRAVALVQQAGYCPRRGGQRGAEGNPQRGEAQGRRAWQRPRPTPKRTEALARSWGDETKPVVTPGAARSWTTCS